MARTQAAGGESPESLLQTAFQHHQAGERAAARKCYERVLSLQRTNPVALQMLASIHFLEGKTAQAEVYRDKALIAFREATKAQPRGPQPRAGLVNLLLASGQVDEAETHAAHLPLGLNPFRHPVAEFNRRRHAAYSAGHPPILINTIPKSASESIWNRLADRLEMAQCHASIGLFPHCMPVPLRVAELGAGGIISKEHLAPREHTVQVLRQAGLSRVVVHLRDPRQVAVSWAHFVRDSISVMPLGPLWRDTCPPAAVLNGSLNDLMDWCVDSYIPLVVDFIQRWRTIANDPDNGLDVLFTTFEHFADDPGGYLDRVVTFHDIPVDAAAREGGEDAHLREGRTDEWREVLSVNQARRAREAIGTDVLDTFDWPRT